MIWNLILNKLVDQYNNTYHRSIGSKNSIDGDCSALTEEIESGHKATKFKVGNRVKITRYNNISSKGYTKKLVKRNICY